MIPAHRLSFQVHHELIFLPDLLVVQATLGRVETARHAKQIEEKVVEMGSNLTQRARPSPRQLLGVEDREMNPDASPVRHQEIATIWYTFATEPDLRFYSPVKRSCVDSYTSLIGPGYCDTKESIVNSVTPSTVACATKILSKGSL